MYGKVVSALIIAAIGYVLGIAAGYINPRQREVYGGGGLLVCEIILVAAKRGRDVLTAWVNGSVGRLRIAWRIVWILTVVLSALALWQTWSGRV